MLYVMVLQQMPAAEELEPVAKSRSSTVRLGVGSGVGKMFVYCVLVAIGGGKRRSWPGKDGCDNVPGKHLENLERACKKARSNFILRMAHRRKHRTWAPFFSEKATEKEEGFKILHTYCTISR